MEISGGKDVKNKGTMKLATWQKAGIVITGAGLLWAIISSFLNHPTTTAAKMQSIGDIKTGDYSPVTIKQQIIDKAVSQTIIDPSKIYLSLWEFSREIALNQNGVTVPPIYPMKPNEEFIFRVALRQENDDGLYLPDVHITFPDNVEVTPDMSDIYRAGAWTKNNDATNTYYLSYSNNAKFYNSTLYNLPALRIKIKDAIIPMSYRITVDGLSRPITRNLIIDTSLDYNKYYKEHFSFMTGERVPEIENAMSDDTAGMFRRIVYAYNENTKGVTASASCVSINPRTMPFTLPLDAVKPITQTSGNSKVSFFQNGNYGTSSATPDTVATSAEVMPASAQRKFIAASTVSPDAEASK